MSTEDHDQRADARDDQLASYDDALLDGVESGVAGEPASDALRRRLDLMRRLHALGDRPSSTTSRNFADTRGDEPVDIGAAMPGRIGRFEIRGQLGQGGFGIVLLAFDASLQREVALKVPRLGTLASDSARDRFVREAYAAAALDHPNIVPVFEVGTDGPACYIVSAVCHGPNLSEWIREQTDPVSPRLAAELVMTLARAVHHAHGRGVVHRDLKPNNVLLEPCEPSAALGPAGSFRYTPKLVDLGLAKLDSGDPQETASHMLMGTASYMAPEQASGKTEHSWAPCDIYALGVMLYEILVGRPPLVGETDIETLQRVQIEEPLGPRRIRPGVPRDLDTICLKCLEKDPARRYATAELLAADLDRFLAEKPIQARRTSTVEHAWRWCRRNRITAALLFLIVAVTVAGFAGVAGQWARAERAWRETDKQRVQAVWSSQQTRRAVDEFLTAVGAEQLADEPQFEQVRRTLLEKAAAFYEDLLAKDVGAGPEVAFETARAHLRLGTLYKWLDEDARALASLDHARRVLNPLHTRDPRHTDYTATLAEVHQQRGLVHFRTQRLSDSETEFARAAELLASLPPDKRQSVETRASRALIHADRGRILEMTGRSSEARAYHQESVEEFRSIVALVPDELQYREDLSRLLHWTGSLEPPASQADMYAEALDVVNGLVAKDPAARFRSRQADLHNDLGAALWQLNRKDEAESHYRRCIEIFEELIRDFPSVGLYRQSLATSLGNLAFQLAESSRFEEADPLSDRCIALLEELVAEMGHVASYLESLASAYNHKGIRYLRANDAASAIQPLEKCAELHRTLREKFPGVPRYGHALAGVIHNIASSRMINKEFDAAIVLLEEARDLQLEFLRGEPGDFVARSYLRNHYNFLGRCHSEMKRDRAALASFDEALHVAGDLYAEFRDIDEVRMSLNSIALVQAIVLLKAEEPDVRDPFRAVQLLEGATERSPAFRNYWTWLALAHYRSGSPGPARDAIGRSLELIDEGDNPAMPLLIQSLALHRLGETVAAREALDQATTHIDESKDELIIELLNEATANFDPPRGL